LATLVVPALAFAATLLAFGDFLAAVFILGDLRGETSTLAATAAAVPLLALALAVASPRAAIAPPAAVVTLTLAVPESIIPMLAAAALDRSMIRPPMKGPRSLIRTTTERPLARFWTSTFVPKGSERCAAVSSFGFISSPLAVLLDGNEYQDAWPSWSACA
jgi:hypothetical protein